MSKDIETEVWNFAPVSSGNLLILLALADNADTTSRLAWPGVPSLARRARVSERQAKRCIKALQKVGLITVKPNASPLKTNLYCITPPHSWKRIDGPDDGDLDNMSPPDTGPKGDTHGPSDVTSEAGRCDTHVPSDVTPMAHQIGQYGPSDVTYEAGRCDTHVPSDVTPMSPKPSGEPSDIEPSVLPPPPTEVLTPREAILTAAGHDKSGVTANGRVVGNAGEMQEVDRWGNDLCLSLDEILTVIRDVMSCKRDGPPQSLRYFTKAMQRFAAEKAKPPLVPTSQNGGHCEPGHQHQRTSGASVAGLAHQRLIAGFQRAVDSVS